MAIEAVSNIQRLGVGAFEDGVVKTPAYPAVAVVTVALGWYQVHVTVADAIVVGASKILCQLVPNADWDADDLSDLAVYATALEGSIIFTITRPGPIVGTFLIIYTHWGGI